MTSEAVYGPSPGIYPVEDSSTFLPISNGRYLPIRIYFPAVHDAFPAIIFSHGAGARSSDYAALGNYWASHGYVSIHPTHIDSIELLKEKVKTRSGFRDLVAGILKDPQSWIQRVQDIELIIDNLCVLGNQVPGLASKINTENIGVAGHSLGAYTAQLIGGATITLPVTNEVKSFADPRIKAVLLLSPQGKDQQGLTQSSWDHVDIPMMVMTGSHDRGAQGQGPEWKSQPFIFAPPQDKFLVIIQDAHHFSFSGRLVEENPMPRRVPLGNQAIVFNQVKVTSLVFLEAYLKSKSNAKAILETGIIKTGDRGQVKVSCK